jgi:hypothetical protein
VPSASGEGTGMVVLSNPALVALAYLMEVA